MQIPNEICEIGVSLMKLLRFEQKLKSAITRSGDFQIRRNPDGWKAQTLSFPSALDWVPRTSISRDMAISKLRRKSLGFAEIVSLVAESSNIEITN